MSCMANERHRPRQIERERDQSGLSHHPRAPETPRHDHANRSSERCRDREARGERGDDQAPAAKPRRGRAGTQASPRSAALGDGHECARQVAPGPSRAKRHPEIVSPAPTFRSEELPKRRGIAEVHVVETVVADDTPAARPKPLTEIDVLTTSRAPGRNRRPRRMPHC